MSANSQAKPAPAQNPYLVQSEPSYEFIAPEGELRDRVNRAIAGTAFLLVAIGIATVVFVYRAFIPPRVVIETSSGWPITGELSAWQDKPAVTGQVLIEAATAIFTRTEKGFPPELADFVASDLLSAISSLRPRGADQEGWSQTMTLTDIRPVGLSATTAIVRYRGRMSLATQQRHAVTDIMYECVYARGKPTAMNALGWRMTDVRELTESEYFDPERQAVRAEKFSPGNLPSMQTAKPEKP